ncbi:replication-associated recombination protein A [Peptostreptococcus canis]|uniref:Replication-associated recombination protein A n=1 Tax=Peptostreptococcus canis TaxID=1159213 RepID=A0ABR6TMY5_9FIRM|nr:replication-associated recombination protein A [Peptostreptococcus canis]MBC2576785.1 replication-associated recombination protein A [Peptostreptococcus canis]MBP1998912.1 putative ATPase [Peptostreptococcus canis]
MPLAEKYRPTEIADVVGQRHIIGKDKLINNMIEHSSFPNMIFYGPPGTGKTTIAKIISKNANKKFYKVNATNSSMEDIRKIIAEIGTLEAKNGILLYIDEIQSFNKKQQQSILEFIENGEITLIASTTENPYHYVYKAILSRSIVIELKSLTLDDIVEGLYKIIDRYNDDLLSKITIKGEAAKKIAGSSNGDLRSAINILELAINESKLDEDGNIFVDLSTIEKLNLSTSYNFDRDGDIHYNLLSAFQKSIRGSDADASVYYLARLIKGGDLISICRRLLVIASEDIGLAYPNAVSIVKACVDSAMQLGLPEARIPLSQATILLATSPKSNSAYLAINSALNDINSGIHDYIPSYLKDAHYSGAEKLGSGIGYKYPHDYPNNYVKQSYMPDNISNRIYYEPQDNKFENSIREFIDAIKK